MTFVRILGFLILAIVIAVAVYLLVLRPRSHRWGATGEEIGSAFPGDDLVPTVKVGYTQAITIDAPPEEVWPWLVQIGYGRGGWYTYDWFYRLTGSADFHDGNRSAERVIPELQDLGVGDSIEIANGMPFEVKALEPNQTLMLLARVDGDTGESFELSDAMPANYMNMSWVYVLEEEGQGSTRLLVRWRGDSSPGLGNTMAVSVPTEAGALIMQPRLLEGIKVRAEAAGRE